MIRFYLYSVILLLIHTTAYALPSAKVTLKVLDTEGQPIEGANANLVFILPGRGLDTGTSVVKGLTNDEGVFIGSGDAPQYIDYAVSKEGYYTSNYKYRFSGVTGFTGFRRWSPWNPTLEVVLKKKINPIPLYVHRMDFLMGKDLLVPPLLNRFVGYDLIARDWVVPYGLGTHRDFLFKLSKHRMLGRHDFHVTLTLKFSNSGDGIQSYYNDPSSGSSLYLPHNAPKSGYSSELIINRESSDNGIAPIPENLRNRDDQNYFFRIRTETDKSGNIVKALYGKIHGGIGLFDFLDKNNTAKLRFNYYLNPNQNDTNLEFDLKQNLFTDLSRREWVRDP